MMMALMLGLRLRRVTRFGALLRNWCDATCALSVICGVLLALTSEMQGTAQRKKRDPQSNLDGVLNRDDVQTPHAVVEDLLAPFSPVSLMACAAHLQLPRHHYAAADCSSPALNVAPCRILDRDYEDRGQTCGTAFVMRTSRRVPSLVVIEDATIPMEK
jgi:hypothetical protein